MFILIALYAFSITKCAFNKSYDSFSKHIRLILPFVKLFFLFLENEKKEGDDD